jgi:hypothetical protein
MHGNTIELEGTLQADGKLILDEKPALAPGRVRLCLQAITGGNGAGTDVIAVLELIRTGQAARGHVARSKEEIDATISAMRGEDEERMNAIEQLHKDSQRGCSGKSP